MVKKVTQPRKQHRAIIRLIEVAGALVLITIFTLKVASYLQINIFDPASVAAGVQRQSAMIDYKIHTLKFIGSCADGKVKIDTGWQFVCRDSAPASNYLTYFDSASRDPNGSEVIYDTLDKTDTVAVSQVMNGTIAISGFADYSFTNSKEAWQADPYSSDSWRFNYYSLRWLIPLINDAYTARDPAKAAALARYIDSFTTNADQSPYAWSDPYTVAWSSMVLTDAWWKLRSIDALPITTSTNTLQSLEKHGALLVQSKNYDTRYGHGTDEAAALLALGQAFPFLPAASSWRDTGASRSLDNLTGSVDGDGALKTYSPSYQFEALAKYWNVYRYVDHFNLPQKAAIKRSVDAMINYSTYLLQPDRRTPIINTSFREMVNNNGDYAEIANYSPAFKYVVTGGKSGKAPANSSVQFLAAGQSLLRSSWDASNFTQATQVLFNYASTVSSSAQPGNLSLDVYSKGKNLLTSPGSYSTSATAPLHSYFYSTESQNTVTVDGRSQTIGEGSGNELITKSGYVTQSASNYLNPNVTHERQVTMLAKNVILVIDNLKSTDGKQHTFDQRFNFDPSLSYEHTATGALATDGTRTVQIDQLQPADYTYAHYYNQTDPNNPGGICSLSQGQIQPCHQLSTMQKGTSARFVTLITINSPYVIPTINGDSLDLSLDKKSYSIDLKETTGHNIQATSSDPKAPKPQETPIDDFANTPSWTSDNGTVAAATDTYNSKPSISLTGKSSVMTKAITLDLSDKNLLLRMKVLHPSKMQSVNLTLESGGHVALLNLMNAYKSSSTADIGDTDLRPDQVDTSLGWSTLSLAKGGLRNQQGQWSISDGDFDWSTITRVNLSIASNDGSDQTVLFSQFAATPEQSQSSVSLVFDDGSSSILPAIDYMNKHDMQGTIGVIGKYSSTASRGYLTIPQLHQLQDHDWSLVNHSYDHVDGPSVYSNTGNIEGFRTDILKGSQFLQSNGLNNTPNWYIYPHGTTSPALQTVLSQYYKFARTEQTGPETFPYGSPLAVKDFVVYDTTTPEDVARAVSDAQKYNQTLILTFHRIHTLDTDKSGYPYESFKRIIDDLQAVNANVVSFKQLDTMHGVAQTNMVFAKPQGSQITADIHVHYANPLYAIQGFLGL